MLNIKSASPNISIAKPNGACFATNMGGSCTGSAPDDVDVRGVIHKSCPRGAASRLRAPGRVGVVELSNSLWSSRAVDLKFAGDYPLLASRGAGEATRPPGPCLTAAFAGGHGVASHARDSQRLGAAPFEPSARLAAGLRP